MKPIQHPLCQRIYASPEGWNEEKMGKCQNLPIHDHDGCKYSWWKPSLSERIKLIFGWPVRVVLASRFLPPISVEVERN